MFCLEDFPNCIRLWERKSVQIFEKATTYPKIYQEFVKMCISVIFKLGFEIRIFKSLWAHVFIFCLYICLCVCAYFSLISRPIKSRVTRVDLSCVQCRWKTPQVCTGSIIPYNLWLTPPRSYNTCWLRIIFLRDFHWFCRQILARFNPQLHQIKYNYSQIKNFETMS